MKESDKKSELEMLLNANLSTIIDEEDDQITVYNRFVFDRKSEKKIRNNSFKYKLITRPTIQE